MNIVYQQKCVVLFDFGINAMCNDNILNHAWWLLEFSPLVQLTKWSDFVI